MINVDFSKSGGSKIEYKGSKIELMQELVSLIHAMREQNVLDDSDINFAINLAKKSEEELREEVLNILENNLNLLESMIRKNK